MKRRGTAQKGHASSTAKWLRKYSQCGDNVPPDVQGAVLLSACTVQTASNLIISQPVPSALFFPAYLGAQASAVSGIKLKSSVVLQIC